ncbi:hypothetical protein Tco_0928227 [Tanacetum coccineum]
MMTELVDYDGDDEEEPEEEPEEESEPNNEHGNQISRIEMLEKIESSDSVSSESESSDFESRGRRRLMSHSRGLYEVGESSYARDSSYVSGLAPWALRRDLETSRARARLT